MAAITENKQICLSFGWLGSNALTIQRTDAKIKAVYIYKLFKDPIYINIPATQSVKIQALPFICPKQCVETLSVEKTALKEISIVAHLYPANCASIEKTQPHVQNVSLNYSVRSLTSGLHYRLTISSELCAYLITETAPTYSVPVIGFCNAPVDPPTSINPTPSVPVIGPCTAQVDKPKTTNSVSISDEKSKEIATQGLFLYVSNILSERMMKNAKFLWTELMMEPDSDMHTSFLNESWIAESIKTVLTTAWSTEQIFSLYHKCRPFFNNWHLKNPNEQREIARNALWLLCDTVGTSWMTKLMRFHLTSLINVPMTVKIEKILEETVTNSVEDSIKFAYAHLLQSNTSMSTKH